MPIRLQSSILLHITNLLPNFRWTLAYHFHPLDPLETRPRPLLATSTLVKISQSRPPISHPLIPTTGMLSIPPCHMAHLYLHILAYQCKPRAPCRAYVAAAAGPILPLSLVLLRILSLQRRDEKTPIRKLDRAPSHPIICTIQTVTSASSTSSPIELPMASWLERGRNESA